MCKCQYTKDGGLGQLFPALTLHGGAWTVRSDSMAPGSFLVTAPEAAPEVVRVAQDGARRLYRCSCAAADEAGCVHTGLVGLFLALRPEEIADTLGHVLRWTLAGREKGWDAARLAPMEARVALLQNYYQQRTAAQVPSLATEAASAASLPAGKMILWAGVAALPQAA